MGLGGAYEEVSVFYLWEEHKPLRDRQNCGKQPPVWPSMIPDLWSLTLVESLPYFTGLCPSAKQHRAEYCLRALSPIVLCGTNRLSYFEQTCEEVRGLKN